MLRNRETSSCLSDSGKHGVGYYLSQYEKYGLEKHSGLF